MSLYYKCNFCCYPISHESEGTKAFSYGRLHISAQPGEIWLYTVIMSNISIGETSFQNLGGVSARAKKVHCNHCNPQVGFLLRDAPFWVLFDTTVMTKMK
jgi:hypothetical protein